MHTIGLRVASVVAGFVWIASGASAQVGGGLDNCVKSKGGKSFWKKSEEDPDRFDSKIEGAYLEENRLCMFTGGLKLTASVGSTNTNWL